MTDAITTATCHHRRGTGRFTPAAWVTSHV